MALYQTLLCLFEHHEHSITGPNNGVGGGTIRLTDKRQTATAMAMNDSPLAMIQYFYISADCIAKLGHF